MTDSKNVGICVESVNEEPSANENVVVLTDLLGLTLDRIIGCEVGSEDLRFVTKCGREFRFWHEPDCCESVEINQVDGDVADLLGSPLFMAEFVESPIKPESIYCESGTWTFYRFATSKGYVTIRWLGESNGYYSESVCFGEMGVFE